MYDALCYSCKNENKLVEICFYLKLHIFLLIGGGLNREGGLIELEGAYLRGGGLNRENTVVGTVSGNSGTLRPGD